MATEIFGAIGVLGMLGNLGMSGYNAQVQGAQLQQQLQEVQDNNAKLDALTKGLLSTKYQMTEEIREEIQGALEQYDTLKTKISATKLLYDAEFRSIELAGIIILAIVFFMLVIKQLGFNQVISDVVFAPFRALRSKMRGNVDSK